VAKVERFIKYSKSSSKYIQLKNKLFEENKNLLDDEIRAAQQYRQGILGILVQMQLHYLTTS
jgi:hypothetical protein